MNAEKGHIDLLALLEGRLEPEQAAGAQEHLAGCPACQEQARALEQVLGLIDGLARRAGRAFGGPERLEAELADWLEGQDPAELSLEPGQAVAQLPPPLAQAVAAARSRSLSERIKKSVSALTGRGAEAARELAQRLSSGAAPAAAPAIRKDATKVDQGPAEQDDQQDDQDQGPGQDQER